MRLRIVPLLSARPVLLLVRPEDLRYFNKLVEGLRRGHDILEVLPLLIGSFRSSPPPRAIWPGPAPEDAKAFWTEDDVFRRLIAATVGALHLAVVLVVVEPPVVGCEVSGSVGNKSRKTQVWLGRFVQGRHGHWVGTLTLRIWVQNLF